MWGDISLWKRKADFQRTKWELNSELPVDQDLAKTSSFHSSLFYTLFSVRFEWSIQRKSRSYCLVEHARISGTWYLFLAASIIGMSAGYIGSNQLQGGAAAASLIIMALFLPMFPLLFAAVIRCKSPIENLFQESRNHVELIPVVSLFLVMTVPFLLIPFGNSDQQLVGLAGVSVALVGYYSFEQEAAEFSFRWQSRLDEIVKQLPIIVSNYVVFTLFGSFLPILFVGIHRQEVFLALLRAFPVVFPLILSVMFTGLLALIVYGMSDSWSFEVSRFHREGRNIQNRIAVALTASTVVAFSIAFGLLSYLFLSGAAWVINQYGSFGVYVLVFVSALPILFVGIGLVYQVISVVGTFSVMLHSASSFDQKDVLDLDAAVYVLDYSGVFAGVLTLFDDYILISEGLLDELTDEELAVVVAHEEAHIRHNESLITLLISVLSPLVLTGKNVLYAVLNFRAREYRADRYAADKIGSQKQVVETLDHLQEISNSNTAEKYSTVAPTLVSFDSGDGNLGAFDRVFGFYFGDFAFSQAHPTLEERKKQFE